MKHFLLCAVAIILTQTAFAQKDTVGLNIPVKDGAVVYEKVLEVAGKSEPDLFRNASKWIVDYFSGSKDILLDAGKNDGMVAGKGKLPVPFKGALGTVVYYDDKLSIEIDCKDNKCRLRIYSQLLSSPRSEYGQVITTPEELIAKLLETGKSQLNNKQARRMLQSMNDTIGDVIQSFNKAMLVKTGDF
jgi:hypothetical protein